MREAGTQIMGNEEGFVPRQGFENALRGWWLIVLLTVWGAAVGWLIHRARPPVYEARVVFYVSLDYTQIDEMTQFEQDQAINGAGALIGSTPVAERVVARARSQGIDIDVVSLFSRAAIERKREQWILRLRDPDPRMAATLANLWGQEAIAALHEAHRHALQAQELATYLAALESCLQPTPPPQHLAAQCTRLDLTTLPSQIQTIHNELEEELIASQGLFPALVFDLTRTASVPQEPVRYGLNSQVLAGGLIGFVLGVWAVNLALPARLGKRLRRA